MDIFRIYSFTVQLLLFYFRKIVNIKYYFKKQEKQLNNKECPAKFMNLTNKLLYYNLFYLIIMISCKNLILNCR